MKTLKYISILLVLLTFSQCRSFEVINQSPNQVELGLAHPADMMDEIICNGALNYNQRFYDTYAELMQYTCIGGASNEYIHRYYFGASYIENSWSNCAKWAVNADHMYELAVEKDSPNYQAIALTLRAFWMDQLTAIFGMVPFEQAFSLRDKNINKPKFDEPKHIYKHLIEDLELANSLYEPNRALDIPSKDKLYNGDTKKWQKFTNSLSLRILMRLSNRSTDMEILLGESVAQKIKKIIDNPSKFPIMDSYADNATVYFSGESPFQHSWGGYSQSTMSGHRAAEHFVAQLNGKNDPRKWIWLIPWSNAVGWMGVQSGMPGDDTATAGYPWYNPQIFISYKLPVSFMRHDEVCFIIAEAYWRNDDDHWAAISGQARITEWYNKGIRSSCEFWRYIYVDYYGLNGRNEQTSYRNFAAVEPMYDNYNKIEMAPVIDDASIDNFISNSVPFDVKDGLRCIIEQKFVANFLIMTEAWNDYRRTGYPQLTIGTGVLNNGVLPMRLIYPTKTKTTNPDEYNKCVETLRATYYDGGDNMLTPVWWSEAGLAKEIR